MANEVLYDRLGNTALVTINRPEKMNAANKAVHNGLVDAFEKINRDPDVRAGILTGAGEKAFCAGGDLAENLARAQGELPEEEPIGPAGEGWIQPEGWAAIDRVFKPMIAAVNGYAIGGGFGLALSCDLRLCSENAEFGTQTKRKHFPDRQAANLAHSLPLGWAMWFGLTGDRVNAETAYRLGIVHGVYPLPNLLEEAIKLAEIINANGLVVVQQTKQFVYNSLDMPLSTARKMEGLYYERVRQNPDYDEGSTAFVEKRHPQH